jgi:transcriptional regulator GlxA family with amidase domain
MSERTFQRRFRSLTGLPPLKWILGERLEQARIMLETGSAVPDDIARSTDMARLQLPANRPRTLRKKFKRVST